MAVHAHVRQWRAQTRLVAFTDRRRHPTIGSPRNVLPMVKLLNALAHRAIHRKRHAFMLFCFVALAIARRLGGLQSKFKMSVIQAAMISIGC